MSGSETLARAYPVNTLVELTLAPGNEKVCGLVYCTDEISQAIVLKKSLVHTTLSSEVTVIHASSVTKKRIIDPDKEGKAAEEIMGTPYYKEELKLPLPNVNRRALEDRERRALRIAEETFSKINDKVSHFVIRGGPRTPLRYRSDIQTTIRRPRSRASRYLISY